VSWARCAACGETFNSDYGFDQHRVRTTGSPSADPEYDWRCATPAELQEQGWSRNIQGRWITSQMADSALDRRTRTAAASENALALDAGTRGVA